MIKHTISALCLLLLVAAASAAAPCSCPAIYDPVCCTVRTYWKFTTSNSCECQCYGGVSRPVGQCAPRRAAIFGRQMVPAAPVQGPQRGFEQHFAPQMHGNYLQF